MRSYQSSAKVTLFACRAVAVIVLVLMAGFPMFTDLYHQHFSALLYKERVAVVGAFYLCVPAVLLALWNMDRLMKNILGGSLFVQANVGYIRCVRWCCLEVSIVCLVAAIGFPGIALLSVIMLFLCLVLTVIGQVMKSAVAIREENDLTV